VEQVEISPEDRASRAEQALEHALEERSRLWAELQLHRSQERELEHLRRRLTEVEGSVWWRLGGPLRLAPKAIRDPGMAAKVFYAYLRRWLVR